MFAIKQFESERKEWESERDNLNLTITKVNTKKEEVEQELGRLAEEVERLRTTEASRPQQQSPARPSEEVRSRHEHQLALMTTIDSLRQELNEEQVKARTFSRRASQAESYNQRLAVELGRCKGEAGPPQSPRRQPGEALPGAGANVSYLHDELQETQTSLHRKSCEVHDLENETLRIREELNNEKQKVIELKLAAHKRSAAWKQELAKLSEEIDMKQRLEELVVQLRQNNDQLRRELRIVSEREEDSKRRVEQLQRELEETRAAKEGVQDIVAGKDEELEIVSKTFGSQLIAMEQELTQQVQKTSRCLDLFLHHAHEPLAKIRQGCRQIAQSGDAGNEMWAEKVPALYEVNMHDLKTNLVMVVDLLRFAAKILEAHGQHQQPPQQEKADTITWPSFSSTKQGSSWLTSAFA